MEQQQTKHSELTFQVIVESTPNAIVLVNKEGKIAYVNNQTEKLFGYSRTELVGQMVEGLIPKRYHENHSGFRNMFFTSPTVRAMGAGRELFAVRKNGTEFPIEIGLNPVVTVDGTLVLASIIDITERKKAEERFRLVVESAPNAMILVNNDGVITLVNYQTEKLFGYERNELIGIKLEMLIPERFRKNHPSHRNMFFASPSVREMGAGRELFGLRKDGTEIQVEIGLNPIGTDEGQMVLASVIDITERKKAEERFRLVVDSAPNAMVLINAEGIITLVNYQTEKLFGYDRQELIGIKLEMLIPERFRKNHPGHRSMFFASPSVRAMGAGRELFGLRKDGTEIQVEIGLNPIETDEGQMVLASVIDITERKKAEERFRLVVESAPNAMVLINEEGIISLVNYQTEKLFGYDRQELIGIKLEMLIPERFRSHHPDHRNMFFASPSVRSMGAGRELFGLRKDGTEIQVEIGLNPIETDDGQMVLASVIDITERKKAEERFRLVVESAPNAMILINQEGIISLVNYQTEKLFGYDRQELIGIKLETLIPERFRKNHPGHRNMFFASPSVREMGAGRELFGLRKDGTEIQVEIGLNPIGTDEGQMVLASVIDITERKIQQDTVIKQKELEIKNKELEQFAYLASHDLQEPLRTVSNYIETIEEDYGEQLDGQVNNYLKIISLATKRMSTLVRALLDFSHLGRNKKLVEADCKKIVRNVLSDLENLIKTTSTAVSVEELPRLNVYETELRLVFQNLISNAIKFRRPGVKHQVNIGCERMNGEWKFSVKDNGIGIGAQYFERIFYIFQRLHPDDQFEGHGIGLANCKKIVELHGGKIWIDSTIGSGSTFYFTIPNLN